MPLLILSKKLNPMNTIIRLLILLLVCMIQIQASNKNPGALAFVYECKNTNACCYPLKEDSAVTIKVIPNPTSEFIKVEGTTEGAELLLYNSKGKLLLTKKAGQYSTQINISDLEKGIYYLRYRLNNSRFTDKTILVS